MINDLSLKVNGAFTITDDLGNTVLEKSNAVHPQNMARVIARALAHEENGHIYRMAFGNGGTVIDAANTVTYFAPNDGQIPDTNTWNSTMYNRTYHEVVDDQSADISTGPGAVPGDDPVSVPHVSGPGVRSVESGLISQVVVTCVLNGSEPTSQYLTDIVGTPGFPESDFTFDEIALFTAGAPLVATAGYQDVDVSIKLINSDTGLLPSATYTFQISVNGATTQTISVTTPAVGSGIGGGILYGDLLTVLNAQLAPYGARADISGGTTVTYGFLRFISNALGSASSVAVTNVTLFSNLTGFAGIKTATGGADAGVQNAPTAHLTEAERMITHAVFSPVTKAANRSFTIRYVLTISVARTVQPSIV